MNMPSSRMSDSEGVHSEELLNQSKPFEFTTTPSIKTEKYSGNVLGWNGSNDIDDPMNWPKKKKQMTIGLISTTTFLA